MPEALFAKYRYDPVGFSEDILGVRLHRGQRRFARRVVKRGMDGWRAAYLTLALSAGNRAGKTLLLAVLIIHSCVFKLGIKPPDDTKRSIDRWQALPYMAFHFAIQQEIAELVFAEITAILAGVHVAQRGDGCPMNRMIPHVATWDRKYNGAYKWIVFDDILGGAQVHFRTTAEKAVGSLGRDMHLITYDECGLDPQMDWVVQNVMHLRRLGTGGQLILTSTPEEGLTEFADYWYMGDPEAPDRRPGRMSLRMSSRDNIGYGLTQKDFDILTADMDEDHVKQNIDGYFIQGRTAYFNAGSVDWAFDESLPEDEPARPNSWYVQGMDPAKKDPAWSIVLHVTVLPEDKETGEVTAFGVHAARGIGSKTTPSIVGLALQSHNSYEVERINSHCSTAVDATGFGGKMFKEALEQEIPVVRAIEFGGSVSTKRKLLGDLRTMLDSGRLFMPRSGVWLQIRRQLLGYKLEDSKLEQDAVMALACAVAEIRRTPAEEGATSVPFDAFAVPVPARRKPGWWES